jgi:hypothetical protein
VEFEIHPAIVLAGNSLIGFAWLMLTAARDKFPVLF